MTPFFFIYLPLYLIFMGRWNFSKLFLGRLSGTQNFQGFVKPGPLIAPYGVKIPLPDEGESNEFVGSTPGSW